MFLMIAVVVAVFVLIPVAMAGVALVAVSGGFGAALGGCGGHGGPGGGSHPGGNHTWSAEQMANAETITSVVRQRKLPQRAAIIALSTAMVESKLINVHHGDRDSLGLFQQRPSMGWGSPEQITNPVYATGKFLDHLLALPRWHQRPPGEAQQAVQGSAFPERYAPQEKPASALMSLFWSGPDNPLPAPGQDDELARWPSAGCPDRSGSNIPADPQKLPAGFQLPADHRQRAAVEFALAQIGKPYVYGAKGPDAFDCSGLTQAAWAHAGVPISAGTSGQRNDGRAVAGIGELQPGDLVFIPGSDGSPGNPRHVGLYAGGGLIVNAYDEHHGVIVEQAGTWSRQIVAIRRVGTDRTIAGPAPEQGGIQP